MLMLMLTSSAAHAGSLKDFTGIWAPADGGAVPADVACKKELASREHQNPSQRRPYELVGICERGIDILYQPVHCHASNVIGDGTSVQFDERCTTKGEYIDSFHSRIIMKGKRSIEFSRTPTQSGGGYSPDLKIRYIRCNRAYSCKR